MPDSAALDGQIATESTALNAPVMPIDDVGAGLVLVAIENATVSELDALPPMPSDKRLLHQWATDQIAAKVTGKSVHAAITAAGFDVGKNPAPKRFMQVLERWKNEPSG